MISVIWSAVAFMIGVIAFIFLVGVAGILVKEDVEDVKKLEC